jgi:ATP-dependent RNA helicase RhlE
LTFDTLGLRPESLRAIADQGYVDPTPVQAQAIPLILEGRDVLAGAQTGTGKTAAFVLPMLQNLHARPAPGPRRVRALVVVPTRELAMQVEQAIRTYGAHRPVRSTTVFGGVSMDRQVRALRAGAEIVVATPGRLLDHVRQRTIDLGRVEILVLDEADRMLDMGFIRDLRAILALLPDDRQSLLFSATFTPHIRALAEDLLRDPASVDAEPRNTAAAPIRQLVHPVDAGRKRQLLSHLVRSGGVGQTLVFTRTKRGADRLAEQLVRDGIDAAAIHGNKSQPQRVRALTAFKEGRTQVLVATDVAARGLDIEALPHVVNFELPAVPEDYVHRIGRTGRAGLAGNAISLVSAEEQELMQAIERHLRHPLDRVMVDGFAPTIPFRSQPVRGARDRAQGTSAGTFPGRGAPRRAGMAGAPRREVRPVATASQERSPGGPMTILPGERFAAGRAHRSEPGGPRRRDRSGATPSGRPEGRYRT